MSGVSNWGEFFALVRKTREAQRLYSKTRRKTDLALSKDFERKLDRAIEHIEQSRNNRLQRELF